MGGDTVDGGAGEDTIDYTGSAARVIVNLTNGFASGGDADGDVLTLIESAIGSAGDDILVGSSTGNTLIGGGGNDALRGWGGNDLLEGGAGGDVLYGGAGDDTADYAQSAVHVVINLANGYANGGDATGDTLSEIENLIGSAHEDFLSGDASENVLVGGSGNDTLRGWGGDDILYGGADADLLDGGQQDDQMFGGAGGDTFFFRPGWGRDIVGDYEDDIDEIDLTLYGFTDTTAALAFATEVGNDTVFEFASGETLTVRNATKAELQDDLVV